MYPKSQSQVGQKKNFPKRTSVAFAEFFSEHSLCSRSVRIGRRGGRGERRAEQSPGVEHVFACACARGGFRSRACAAVTGQGRPSTRGT